MASEMSDSSKNSLAIAYFLTSHLVRNPPFMELPPIAIPDQGPLDAGFSNGGVLPHLGSSLPMCVCVCVFFFLLTPV